MWVSTTTQEERRHATTNIRSRKDGVNEEHYLRSRCDAFSAFGFSFISISSRSTIIVSGLSPLGDSSPTDTFSLSVDEL
eukprot:scaffold678_cov146-Skeletonema_menzelii.AAC.6